MPVIRTADLSANLAAHLFESMNVGVEFLFDSPFGFGRAIFTDTDPEELLYPEGWYYANGTFRNKHNSSTGLYEEIPIAKRDGTLWH